MNKERITAFKKTKNATPLFKIYRNSPLIPRKEIKRVLAKMMPQVTPTEELKNRANSITG
jgi:hypothetical protein